MSDTNVEKTLPARLDVNQTAALLGFAAHDIPILTSAKLLTPLGSPAVNAPKFYAKVTVLQLASDARWLHKATVQVGKYWQVKRARRLVSVSNSNDIYQHEN